MAEFWVGARGDLTPEQFRALEGARVGDELRKTEGGRYPNEWRTLRTFIRVEAADRDAAVSRVADALGLPSAELLAVSAGAGTVFG